MDIINYCQLEIYESKSKIASSKDDYFERQQSIDLMMITFFIFMSMVYFYCFTLSALLYSRKKKVPHGKKFNQNTKIRCILF